MYVLQCAVLTRTGDRGFLYNGFVHGTKGLGVYWFSLRTPCGMLYVSACICSFCRGRASCFGFGQLLHCLYF